MASAHEQEQASAARQPSHGELPTRNCDVVMKGGITSGVVYPGAIVELARTYRFKSIGGTSAGAIAAAATAAAELGRSKGLDSFAELATLPQWLGQPADSQRSNLFALFQPEAQTGRLFSTLLGFLGDDRGKAWRVLRAALSNYAGVALLGALPGLLLLLLVLWQSGGWVLTGWGVVCALVMVVAGCVLAVAGVIARSALVDVPANGYGLCRGYAPAPAAGAPPALTNWLTALLNRLAGLPEDGDPLTFGQLWGHREARPTDRLVNLVMMTTNLSHGRPYRLPFETNIFFFSPKELAQYFPPTVVDWMVRNRRRAPQADDPVVDGEQLLTFPLAADLPVVVATRMSLSFPILLSAVPLYAVQHKSDQHAASMETAAAAPDQPDQPAQSTPAAEPVTAGKCWFSDGGIASNFPIHFFDAPLPRWPTFGINLRSYPPGVEPGPDPAASVRMARDNRDQIGPFWTWFEETGVYGKLFAFLGVIVNTARTWTDETQLSVPGYRDRIVHIQLGKQEGGLNLKMEAKTIEALSQRGQVAGTMLLERFVNPGPQVVLTWDNHRWVRYRSTMALLEEMFDVLGKRLDSHEFDPRSYVDLIARAKGDPPASYPLPPAQQAFAQRATDDLLTLIDEWHNSGQEFGDGAPNPRPTLRIQPRI